MEMILVLILGLFMDDNKEFFEAGATNTGKWEYTGKQAPIEGMANLPQVNAETGEKSVYFVRTKN